MSDLKKLFRKFVYLDLQMKDLCKLPNSTFTKVNSKGESLVGMIVQKRLHNEKLIRIAIEKGMDIMMPIRKSSSRTLASAICRAGEKKSIYVVVAYLKDNVHLITSTGDTFLHWLVRQEILQAIREVVTNHEDVDLKNVFSETPLHVAVKIGNLPIIKFLLDRGACVDTVDRNGNTALHLAAYSKFSNKALLMEILLRFNPHLSKKNNLLRTPLDIVCEKSTRDWKSVELLMMTGAHLNGSNSGWPWLNHIEPNSIDMNNPTAITHYRKIVEIMHLHIQLKLSVDSEWECFALDSFIENNCNTVKWAIIMESIENKLALYKESKLANTCITMWDVAVAPLAKVERMFENRRVLQAAFNYPKESDKLDDLVEQKIQIASRKRNFIGSCVPYMEELLKFSLPFLCVENIINNMDERTLQNMLVSYIQETGDPVSANDLFDLPKYKPISIEDTESDSGKGN